MTNEELAKQNAKRRIFQIGFVTRDLEKSMQAWIDNLAVGPWLVLTFTEKTMKNLLVNGKPIGEPFKFLIAATTMGDTQIELIQPVYGPTHLAEFLEEKGAGFHHIKEFVPDDRIPGILKALQTKGIGILQTGEFGPDVHYHLDTEAKLEFIYEIGNCASVDLPSEMVSTYPPEVELRVPDLN
ncbi:VOC family protein [Mesorhizobium sp. B3-1-6]|uniref:VOC family protein n=1 Tax=Mesorhizobium sp. B3-1-6 TaxID=2589895 RepID=UPI001AEEE26F|nr:VOC family protein [Mesorhizobium sp. B3-1-6]